MPTEAVTPGTCRKAVLGALKPALVSLDNVVHFPVTARLINPASILEDDRVATEMAVACRLVKNASQGSLCHQLMMAQTRPKWIGTPNQTGGFPLGGATKPMPG